MSIFSSSRPANQPAPWWTRKDRWLDEDGSLHFAGCNAEELARRHGTPSYIYSGDRITENVRRLRGALDTLGHPTTLFYAMKSNRCSQVLRLLRRLGLGLDICSPGELQWARACGFVDSQLSFTAGSLSRADYKALAEAPEVWINADSLTALRRLAEVSPGRTIGLRVNPAVGLGYGSNELLRYAGRKPTKFGIYLDRFEEALALAKNLGLKVGALHCHAGCGFLTPQLPALAEVLATLGRFLDLAPDIHSVNLGGGLGIPLVEGDADLDLKAWADTVRFAFAKRPGLRLVFEPGDYLVKDAGLLLTEVTQVEEKAGTVFVGVNAGFNVHPEPVFYKLPLEPVPARSRAGEATQVSIIGNINEALDVWAEDRPLPPLEEGDILCFLNAGGYGASMSSQHCLRTEMKEHFIEEGACEAPQPVSPKASEARELNDANKRAWDELYSSVSDLVWGSKPLPFLEQFRSDFHLVLNTPSRLLDAGTGEGRNLPFLLSCGAQETHALDASMSALGKIPQGILARVKTRCADLADTGFDDDSFDGITILDVIETLPDRNPVLGELFRILKPGGLLLCNIPGLDDGIAGQNMKEIGATSFLYQDRYYYEFHSPLEAERLLSSAGFEIVRRTRSEWEELAHPGYRSESHRHISLVFLVRKPLNT